MLMWHRVRAVAPLLLLALTGTAACSPGTGADATDPSGAAAPSPATTPDPDPSEDPPVATSDEPPTTAPTGGPADLPEPSDADVADAFLTQDDDGRFVELLVGQELAVHLDGAWEWDQLSSDDASVALTPVDHLVDPGYVEWLLVGAGTGSATVTTSGSPACGDTSVCPPREVVLTVEVTD